ncbi:hypothetical protein VE04_03612 [Pseudogymnoascus sp. 24MN13]|nr:hypothetical protein VE04_03597 [Pseudogymnoascus sp. 24MN13]OBT55427.1 hypothetical protein VE04_03612 [Pseudogymnoascus sp. 24MN13]
MEQQFLELQKRKPKHEQKRSNIYVRRSNESLSKPKNEQDKEQRRREAAEAGSQLKNLIEYLEACHTFSLALKVITDKSLSTQGYTYRPTIPSAHYALAQTSIRSTCFRLSIS